MKAIKLLFFFTLLSSCLNAQNWQSIPKEQSYIVNPRQFIINPYTNDLWFVNDIIVTMIDPEGNKREFTNELQSNLFAGNDLTFAFTPLHTYFSDNVYGLFTFDNFVKNSLLTNSDFRSIKSDFDTIYIVRSGSNAGFYKFCNNNVISTNKTVTNLAVKNSFVYCDIGVLAQISGPNSTDWNLLYYDPQYMSGAHHDYKFSRHTDTFYVCGKKGISYAYNYDFLDTIAPSNSVNMPARNVLEIEFDHLDRLWAVFGDASNKAFALARYDNGTWVEKYDASNCPINFATYRGFEIDTLGNIWVVDNYNLHTLITPNSPQWLSTIELSNDIAIEVYPNPVNETLYIDFKEYSNTEKKLVLVDLKGKIIETWITKDQKFEIQMAELNRGIYILQCLTDKMDEKFKIIKL